MSLRAQSSSRGFHCKYLAIPWGCATAHGALAQLWTLWLSRVAPVLEVQCVPGTMAQPLMRTRCWFNLEMQQEAVWIILSQVLSGSLSLPPVS